MDYSSHLFLKDTILMFAY